MVRKANFDLQEAHKYFSAECFNRAWNYIEKEVRTAEEEDQMLHLSLASVWHWTQREDRTPKNLSVGYWQVSRVYALMGQSDQARHYGKLSLEAAQAEGVLPFCQGYAYEALARAEATAGNQAEMHAYLAQANQVAATLTDLEDKELLLKDLATIR